MDFDHPLFKALAAKAEATVTSIFEAPFRTDPLLGELSKLHGVAMSLTRAHGFLLEDAVAAALRHSSRFEVSQAVRFPVTDAARRLVAANSADILPKVRLTFDAEAVHVIDLDLAAVSADGSRAVAVDVKRGVRSMSGSRRAALERELLAVRLLLRSFFRQQGYHVDDVAVAVVDLFGGGGLPGRLTVGRSQVDGFFGVPVLSAADFVTDRMRVEVGRRVPALLGCIQVDGSAPSAIEEVDDEPVANERKPWDRLFARTGPKRRPGRGWPRVTASIDERLGAEWIEPE